MTVRGWRLGVVAVLAAICVSGPGRPEVIRTASDLGPLPADRYDFTPQDYQRSQRASALLVRQCMAERGHPDFPLDSRYPSDPFVMTTVSTDYGALDLATARRWGYGWDPAKSRAFQPKGRRMTNAEYADFPACNTKTNRRLMRGIDVKRDWLYASTRAIEVDKAVKRDPRLRAAWDVWSRCVAEQGFTRYPAPSRRTRTPPGSGAATATPAIRSGSGPPPPQTSPANAATTQPGSGTLHGRGNRPWTSHGTATATPPDCRRCRHTDPTSPRCCESSASAAPAGARQPGRRDGRSSVGRAGQHQKIVDRVELRGSDRDSVKEHTPVGATSVLTEVARTRDDLHTHGRWQLPATLADRH